MNKHLVSRRHFDALCAALGLSLPFAGTLDALFSRHRFNTADAQNTP